MTYKHEQGISGFQALGMSGEGALGLKKAAQRTLVMNGSPP